MSQIEKTITANIQEREALMNCKNQKRNQAERKGDGIDVPGGNTVSTDLLWENRIWGLGLLGNSYWFITFSVGKQTQSICQVELVRLLVEYRPDPVLTGVCE